jgi:hypothetical protein
MKTTVTITIEGINLDVEGYFTPDEPSTYDYPGAAAEFEIDSVKLSDPHADIFDLIVSAISMEDIENKVLEAMRGQETDYWQDL